jgi:hypothetical protein
LTEYTLTIKVGHLLVLLLGWVGLVGHCYVITGWLGS